MCSHDLHMGQYTHCPCLILFTCFNTLTCLHLFTCGRLKPPEVVYRTESTDGQLEEFTVWWRRLIGWLREGRGLRLISCWWCVTQKTGLTFSWSFGLLASETSRRRFRRTVAKMIVCVSKISHQPLKDFNKWKSTTDWPQSNSRWPPTLCTKIPAVQGQELKLGDLLFSSLTKTALTSQVAGDTPSFNKS